ELTLDNVSFKESSILKATFNPQCVLNYKSGNFYNCKSMTEITFPKFSALTGNCFQNNKNMVSTNEIVFVEGVTTIACHIFNGCNKVGGEIVFPSTLKEIKEGTFNGTSITSFDFSKCTNLTTIGGGYGGTFANIDTITSYDFSACTNLTTFNGPAMFEGSAILESVILPANLTKIPHKTFAHCYSMQSIVIPASVTDIADESFHSARKNQTVKTFTMYIQGDVKLNTKYVFRDSGAKVEFVLLGVTAEQFKTTNAGIDIVQSGSHSPLDNIEVVDYLDPASPWTFVPGQTRTSHVIVENYCKSLALTGEHKSYDNPCVINCVDCKLVTPKENPVHNESVSIAYENGYHKVGSKHITCLNTGCNYENTAEAESLFICIGYSTPEDGRGGVVIGYTVNSKAINEYESKTGKTLEYGVFAVLKNKLGDNEIFDENGAIANGVVTAEIKKNEYASFEFKIFGFTDENKDVKLAIGAYVAVTDEEKTEYSYMQSGTPDQGDNYCFISYNDILNENK
ncbi:MAG: leucine-rich repeat domain-containing protein, partial [Clostridia bacterium]|nr:leucine-rich repeat domain-containing protein [Clostridia bacterium]